MTEKPRVHDSITQAAVNAATDPAPEVPGAEPAPAKKTAAPKAPAAKKAEPKPAPAKTAPEPKPAPAKATVARAQTAAEVKGK